MSGTYPGLAIPRHVPLASQAEAALRAAIAEGAWRDFLPGERRLSDLLQVSRPTVRAALHALAKEGVISIQHGRRNRLLQPPSRVRPAQPRLVALVSYEPTSHFSLVAYHGISEMRAHLAEQGFATEILVCQARGAGAQRRKLETFVRQNRVFCCVLFSVSRELQQWFVSSGIPALVLGSCHPTIRLPSLDVDYRSVCRHATGTFLSRGHRSIALVVPQSGLAGDLASEEGFREAIAGHTGPDWPHAAVVRHTGSFENLAPKLDALFRSARPPTALLVAKPQHVIFVLAWLLKRGIRVPADVSLIARDYDHLFESVIAHYAFESSAYAHRLSRLMRQLVAQGALAPKPNLIFPTFVPAGTVRTLE